MSVYAKADIARRVMASAMEPSGTHLRRDGRREVAANNSAGNSSVPFDRDRRLTLANPERIKHCVRIWFPPGTGCLKKWIQSACHVLWYLPVQERPRRWKDA